MLTPFTFFDPALIWGILKWVLVFVGGIFVVFALVMMAQVKQMVATIKRPFNGVIVLLSLGYLGLTVLIIIMAIGVL
jgi:hypothetical protein